MIRSENLDLPIKLVLSFDFIHLEPIDDFILGFEKIGVKEFRVVINECHKITSTASGDFIRVTHHYE